MTAIAVEKLRYDLASQQFYSGGTNLIGCEGVTGITPVFQDGTIGADGENGTLQDILRGITVSATVPQVILSPETSERNTIMAIGNFVPLRLKASSTQAVNLLEVQSNADVTMMSISATGYVTLPGAPTTNLHAATKLYVDTAVASLSLTAAVILAPTSSTRNVIQPTSDYVGLTLKRFSAGTTPDFLQFQNQSGVVLSKVDGFGHVHTDRVTFTNNDAGTKPHIRSDFGALYIDAPDVEGQIIFYANSNLGALMAETGRWTFYKGVTVSSAGTCIVPTPTLGTHAATKAYVDSVAGGGGSIADAVALAPTTSARNAMQAGNTSTIPLSIYRYPSSTEILFQVLTEASISLLSVSSTGVLAAANFSGSSSGTNTGDQTITLTGNVTGSGTGSFATTIANNVVTLAKMQTIATQTFLGRNTASTGNVESLSVATVKTMLNLTGTNSGDQTITLTGDVTGSGTGSFATTIASNAVTTTKILNNAVTLAKVATMATASFLGRNTAGTGNVEVLSISTVQGMLGISGGTDISGAVALAPTSSTRNKVQGTSAFVTPIELWGFSGQVSDIFSIKNSAGSILATITASGSISSVSTITGSNLTGTNTGDQTITLTGNITGSGTGSFATTIANNVVTVAKMQQISSQTFLGRNTAGTGNVEILSVATVQAMIGGGSGSITLTGDVTGSGSGSFSTTIASNAVTLSKFQQISTASFLGRTSASTGNVEVLSVASAKALLNLSGTNTGDQTATSLGLGTGNSPQFAGLTISGDVSFQAARFRTSGNTITGTDTNRGYVIVGSSGSTQIQIDDNEIQAMNNNTPADLRINMRGGITYLGKSVIHSVVTSGSTPSGPWGDGIAGSSINGAIFVWESTTTGEKALFVVSNGIRYKATLT